MWASETECKPGKVLLGRQVSSKAPVIFALHGTGLPSLSLMA